MILLFVLTIGCIHLPSVSNVCYVWIVNVLFFTVSKSTTVRVDCRVAKKSSQLFVRSCGMRTAKQSVLNLITESACSQFRGRLELNLTDEIPNVPVPSPAFSVQRRDEEIERLRQDLSAMEKREKELVEVFFHCFLFNLVLPFYHGLQEVADTSAERITCMCVFRNVLGTSRRTQESARTGSGTHQTSTCRGAPH